MAVRDIVMLPDPLLFKKSLSVEKINAKIEKLIDDMYDTMYKNEGIGLAAIQIRVPLRVLVMDIAKAQGVNNPITMINPEITSLSDEVDEHEEGCLSLPDVSENIVRAVKCQASYTEIDGTKKNMQCEGLLARCLQHEIEHLNGVLIIDHISRLKSSRIMRKFERRKKIAEKKGK